MRIVANEKEQKGILDRIDLDQFQVQFDRLEEKKKRNEMVGGHRRGG